jgi:E3 ubiquitin-protein ligase HUWE1
MLDKGFVGTLTNALAEMDLGYPNVKGVVAAVLRPLEYLQGFSRRVLDRYANDFYRSKISNKLSRSGKIKDGMAIPNPASATSSDSEEDDDDDMDDVEVAQREETPNLFQNSALGMYSVVCNFSGGGF